MVCKFFRYKSIEGKILNENFTRQYNDIAKTAKTVSN